MHVLTQDTACVLLHNVAGGVLKDVATGVLIQPANRMMHTIPLDDVVMRVRLARVLSGFDDLDPPIQPQGAEEHKTLVDCFGWPLTWPKTQIRLGTIGRTSGGATSILRPRPRAQPPVVATTNRHQQLLGARVQTHGKGQIESQPPSPPAPPTRDETPLHGDNDDDDDMDIHGFKNTGARQGMYMPELAKEETFGRTRDDQTDLLHTKKRRLEYGLSQDTPPADDQTNKPVGIVFIPNTLR
jgi:hypothetical protein